MKKKHLNLFFPQWQGAGRTDELRRGAFELKKKYFENVEFLEVEVSRGSNDIIENNILGYGTILEQMKEGRKILDREQPSTIFTVGGGCDIEILPISYLNKYYNGNFTVLWIDAHGDLNTPESSPSKNFHGMPLRNLLGDGDKELLKLNYLNIDMNQVIMMGQRDLDDSEKEYIKMKKIKNIEVSEMESNPLNTINIVKAMGWDNIYIHIDLDVLDYNEFPYVMVPAPNGIKTEKLKNLINLLNDNFNVVGISILEYTGGSEKNIFIDDIVNIGINLAKSEK